MGTATLNFDVSGIRAAVAYEYRVAVVNTSGHAAMSNRETVTGYTVGAVQLVAAESDPAAGSIRLRWSRYRDPGFSAYEVVRRQVGTALDTVLFVSQSVMDTAFADATALHGVPDCTRCTTSWESMAKSR